jgi:surface protein
VGFGLRCGTIENWDTSLVTYMESLIPEHCGAWAGGEVSTSAFNEDLSGWDTANVNNMQGVFTYAYAFNADITGWEDASIASSDDAEMMFCDATAWRLAYSYTGTTGLCNRASPHGPPSCWSKIA